MEKKKQRVHTSVFKTQVVLALLKGDKTRNEVCSEFGIHPTQADKWKQKVLAGFRACKASLVRWRVSKFRLYFFLNPA